MTDKKESTTKEYWVGIGRRKSAVAVVKLSQEKTSSINGVTAEVSQYLATPLELVGEKSNFGFVAKVNGGGKVSQLTAIRLGIARALEKYNAEFRTTLKKAGFLTRDPREKERKKPGLRRARRAPQWAKR
ncbi:MAG: 30S ribosomal protein S9 [Candidatus Berkelbacteria bacterium]|nr:30S ribosomal protein S9 [Candidatus Berkelbacteria bacterium]